MSKLSADIVSAAQRLKNDIAFAEVLRYLNETAYLEFLATSPEDQVKREALYHKVNALKDIQATLGMFAQSADNKRTD